jgi:hypothetical protein
MSGACLSFIEVSADRSNAGRLSVTIVNECFVRVLAPERDWNW